VINTPRQMARGDKFGGWLQKLTTAMMMQISSFSP